MSDCWEINIMHGFLYMPYFSKKVVFFMWLLFLPCTVLIKKVVVIKTVKAQPCHCPSLTGEFIQMAGLDIADLKSCPVAALGGNITTNFRGRCVGLVSVIGWLCRWESWRNYQRVQFHSSLFHLYVLSPQASVGRRGTWWSSTRASAGSCTWGGTTPCISTGLGRTCWRAALQRGTWVSWWTTGWPWASSVPWFPRRPMASWDALRGLWPAGRGRFSSPSTLP